MIELKLKRVYEAPSAGDGWRVLVDRLWPRGLSKEKAAVDYWDKEISPSTELREWFGHEPPKWDEFKKRYLHELESGDAFAQLLSEIKKHKTVTLLYSAKDTEHNNALALMHILQKKIK